MPMHDWTRVTAGTFHDFHNAWITHLKEMLNEAALPEPYYALGEQRSGDFGPDVLVLHADDDLIESSASGEVAGDDSNLVATATAPPVTQIAQEAVEDLAFYLLLSLIHI